VFEGVTVASIPLTVPEGSVASYKAANVWRDFIYVPTVAPSTFVVTFDANGGAVTPASGVTGADGKLAAALPVPTRAATATHTYTFAGWFDAAVGGAAVTADKVYAANTTIYAQWTAAEIPVVPGTGKTYSVTWDARGGTVSVTTQTVDSGVVVTSAVATKPGYKFGGWYKDSTYKAYQAFPFSATEDIALYARWKRAVFAPGVALGPNPLAKAVGGVGIFREGDAIKPATLTVYDAVGNVVNKIKIADVGALRATPFSDDPGDRRRVGAWDLRDAKGRLVPDGTYLVRGKVTLVDGTVEKVSVLVGVR
jgi:uncharacterized repeat protein (TIGR02543 family)